MVKRVKNDQQGFAINRDLVKGEKKTFYTGVRTRGIETTTETF